MRPSQRIKELFKEQHEYSLGKLGGTDLMLAMIVEYLDEQYYREIRMCKSCNDAIQDKTIICTIHDQSHT